MARTESEVTTVTSPQTKQARSRWAKQSPRFPPPRALSCCWDVSLDDVDADYRGLIERLDQPLAVLEAAGKTFDSKRLHEYWGAPTEQRDAVAAIAREHVERAVPLPELCNALGGGADDPLRKSRLPAPTCSRLVRAIVVAASSSRLRGTECALPSMNVPTAH